MALDYRDILCEHSEMMKANCTLKRILFRSSKIEVGRPLMRQINLLGTKQTIGSIS